MFDLAIFTLALTLGPSLVSAGIFPKSSAVKMLDPKSFKQAMKTNQTSLVAFVAPWCGHCQRLVPEYQKLAKSFDPLVPVYAIDCDAEENKRLCAEQGVKGFPTVKLFPKGKQGGAITYDGERTSAALFKWTSLRVPNLIKRLGEPKDIDAWVTKSKATHRALLLTEDTKVPLLWKVLGNNLKDKDIELGVHRDKDGESVKSITGWSLKDKGKKSAVLVYPAGSTDFVVYSGKTKLDALSKYFESIFDGTADLPVSPSVEPPKPKKVKSKGKKAASATPDPVSPEPAAEPSEAAAPDPEPATSEYEQAQTEATEVAQEPLGEQVVFKMKEKPAEGKKEEKRPQDEL